MSFSFLESVKERLQESSVAVEISTYHMELNLDMLYILSSYYI